MSKFINLWKRELVSEKSGEKKLKSIEGRSCGINKIHQSWEKGLLVDH